MKNESVEWNAFMQLFADTVSANIPETEHKKFTTVYTIKQQQTK